MNAVRERVLVETELDTITALCTPQPPVPRKLDLFISLIMERLHECPLPSTQRLFEGLSRLDTSAAGHGGATTCVLTAPSPHKRRSCASRRRFGHQAQVDFAHVRLPWGVRYVLIIVLAASRHLVLRFGARQDVATLLTGLTAAAR